MIEVSGLTKRYGGVTAVDDVSFGVRPGVVTGFLGPNGAGKTTTMRMIVGLDRPTAGRATIDGRVYRELGRPLTHVGTLLDSRGVHPKRTARNHLRWVAAANGIGDKRVDEVLGLVGLADVAGTRAGDFSLGMAQRLGLAQALLGDPAHLILDEPVNGLDPEGIRWVRGLLRRLAAEGRTVLVSSHLLSEMAQTADHLLVIGRGKLLADTPADQFTAGLDQRAAFARSGHLDELEAALGTAGVAGAPGVQVRRGHDRRGRTILEVTGATAAQVGQVACDFGVPLTELGDRSGSLEDAFVAITGGDAEYRAGADDGGPAADGGKGQPR